MKKSLRLWIATSGPCGRACFARARRDSEQVAARNAGKVSVLGTVMRPRVRLVRMHAAKRQTAEASEGLASFAEKRAADWGAGKA